MNVSCNKCGKRYVISDDKLVGKTSVKIRCKQCQNLISVAGTSPGVSAVPGVTAARGEVVSAISAGAAPGPWDEDRTRAMPAPDLSATWYAMVQGRQIGPIGLKALSDKVKAGEVSLRTYLWKPGMGDWKRASDVPEVSSVFAGVSAGATATDAQKSAGPRKTTSAAQRDVALANEMPTPEAQGRRSSPSGVNGNGRAQPPAAPPPTGQQPAVRRPQSGVRSAAEAAPAAEPPKKEEPRRKSSPSGAKAAAEAKAAPLDDLFKDVPAPSAPNLVPVQDQESDSDKTKNLARHDPFAALGSPEDKELPPPGEATKFFIAQAGVHKRNPPWKIALFVAIALGVPVGALYLLSSLHIVPLTVTRTTEDGKEVQEEFFSGGGMSGLKDLLTGETKRKAAEAERVRKEKEALARRAATQPKDEVPKPRPVNPNLAAFYQEDDGKKTKVPRNREAESAATQVATGGLADEVAAKVVLDRQKAFNDCIDQALRRNPNLAVGSINVVLHVGPSGAVKQVEVDPPKHAGSDWAQCMVNVGKRIVFPASDGETEVRAPFKIGVSVAP